MLHLNCQVCGNPMYSQNYCGTEADGSLNSDYCSSCYKSGQFHYRQWDGALTNVSGLASPMSIFTSRGPGGGF